MREVLKYIIKLTVLLIVIFFGLLIYNTVFANNEKEKQTISNGIYIIKSAINENYVFDIYNNSQENAANLGMWINNNQDNQKFKVKYLENGYYTISPFHSNKYIDVENNSKELSANVIQWENNNQDNQQWIIKDLGNGYYNIISKSNGLYLTVSSITGNVYVDNGDDSNYQKFKFRNPVPLEGKQTIEDGTYIITSALNSKYVLDIPNYSQKDGELLEIWENKGGLNQKFTITYLDDGYYTIKAECSGKFMEVPKAQFNAKVQQNEKKSLEDQKWIIKHIGNGYYNIISKNNELYMTVTPGIGQNGEIIHMSNENNSNSQKFRFYDANTIIESSTGTYGMSGLKIKGDDRGRDLMYYKYGNGPNVFFATFSVHGFEDKWYQDGTELYQISEGFWENLNHNKYYDLANKWTIYIFPEVNPDGRRYGWTNNGPGRTTLYSDAPSNQGVDLNRCWSSNWVYQTEKRYYSGTEPFQAYESRYLREFLLQNKSQNGQTILVDLHGWTQQLIGNSEIGMYYKKYFPENADTPTYGKGYLINWARNNLGSNSKVAKSALIELPSYIQSSQDVITYNLKDKYINATLSMLRGMGIGESELNISQINEENEVRTHGDLYEVYREYDGREVLRVKKDIQYKVAFTGIIKGEKPKLEDVEKIYNANYPKQNGIWIESKSREKIIELLKQGTNSIYNIDENGYLRIEEIREQNDNDKRLEDIMNSNKKIILTIDSFCYEIDNVTREIVEYPFEKLDIYQAYDIITNENDAIIVINTNSKNNLTPKNILEKLLQAEI